MCYNNCEIEILTTVDGTQSIIKTCGKFKKNAGEYRFIYKLDEDGCILTVKDNVVEQARSGAQNIKIVFRSGEYTECNISDGGFFGAFPVYTHSVTFEEQDGYSLKIVYTLGEDKIELKFTANIR